MNSIYLILIKEIEMMKSKDILNARSFWVTVYVLYLNLSMSPGIGLLATPY